MLSTTICKILLQLSRYPKSILAASLLLCLFSLFSLFNLNLNTHPIDLFSSQSKVYQNTIEFENKVGGLGTFTIVYPKQEDSLWLPLIKVWEKKKNISFLQSFKEEELFLKYRWLYLSENTLKQTLHFLQDKELELSNPLYSSIVEEPQFPDWIHLKPNSFSTIRIFPAFSLSNETAGRTLLHELKRDMLNAKLQGVFTGEFFNIIQQKQNLKKEVILSSTLSLGTLLILLLVFFWRQPFIPLLILFPTLMTLFWTGAIANFIWGEINLLCILLGVLLFAINNDSLVHFLSRYGQERRRGLGPIMAIEALLLETSPILTRTCLMHIIAISSLAFLPFPGIKQFAILASIAIFFNWLNLNLTFPALLLALQTQKKIRVWGKKKKHIEPSSKPFIQSNFLKLALLFLSALPLLSIPNLPIEKDLNSLGFLHSKTIADSILFEQKQAFATPIFLSTPNITQLPPSSIQESLQIKDFQLKNLSSKTETLKQIHTILTNNSLKGFSPNQKKLVSELLRHFPSQSIDSLKIPKKIIQNQWLTNNADFTLLFPTPHLHTPQDYLTLIQSLEKTYPDGKMSGKTIFLAEYIRQTWVYLPILFAFVLLAFLLLIKFELSKFLFSFLLAQSIGIGILWWSLQLLNLRFTPFSILFLPLFISIFVAPSFHIHFRFTEKEHLPKVLRRSSHILFFALFTGLSCFLGFALSSHPTLSNLGNIAIVVMALSLFTALVILPICLDLLCRWKKSSCSSKARAPKEA